MKKKTNFGSSMKIIYSLFISFLTMMQCVVFADAAGDIQTSVNKIVGVIAWFGYAIAFGMFVYVGVKYMMASANERADVKKGAINYIIGAFLIAAASTVANMVVDIAVGSGQDAGGLANSIVTTATDIAK